MGRYSGTLANLVEEAIAAGKPSRKINASNNATSNNSKALWNKVLNYLENHSTTDGAIERPEFASPLPPFSVPSEILDEQLLERKFGPRQDNTILKLAVTAAPAAVVAALCHLQPHAARIPDHRGKLPLHVACRRNPRSAADPDTQAVFDILLAVFEEGLAHRDTAGRTPLHCLFMYHHAPHRSLALVQQFCRDLAPHWIEALEQPRQSDTPLIMDSSTTRAQQHEDFPLPQIPNPSVRDRVPSNATVIPDARHGALPLHYAVMEGASRDVLRYLLKVYPESKRLVDRRGRTPLAWYLGAGSSSSSCSSSSSTVDHTNNNNNTSTAPAVAKLLVTGEPADPQSSSWWDKNKIESATVQLLLSSRSARMADATGRAPLHWAICTLGRHYYHSKQPSQSQQQQQQQQQQHCPSISMKTIHLLLDHYMEALVTGDLQNKTPLHLLFDAVKDVQQHEWQRCLRNKQKRTDLDVVHGGVLPTTDSSGGGGGGGTTVNFSPPLELLEILISGSHGGGAASGGGGDSVASPSGNNNNNNNSSSNLQNNNNHLDDRSPVFMEDTDGRLPIHCAMEVASGPEAIKMLIKAHPTSLVHTTEDRLVSPLHAALLSPYVAPLQSPDTMRLILRAYVASRHGTYVDGRLALKMEDSDGYYPIHYACKNQACLDVIKLFVEEYPKCTLHMTAEGDTPLHTLLDPHVFEGPQDGMPAIGVSLASSDTWTSPREQEFHQEQLSALQHKIRLLLEPMLGSSQVVDLMQTPSFAHGMLPLHIAVAFGAAPYTTIRRMLNKCPASAEKYTTVEGHQYSPLQLHEQFKLRALAASTTTDNNAVNKHMDEEWQHIRELLFSYSPLLEGHRHLNDILMQSVRVVRSELGHSSASDRGVVERSYHWAVEQELNQEPEAAPIEMTETFTSIEVPAIDHGGRPLSKKAIERSRQAAPTPKSKKSRKGKGSAKKNSKNAKAIPHSKSDASRTTKKSIYDDDAVDTGYVVSDDEHDNGDEFEEDYFNGPESVEEYLSDESDERFDSFDEDYRTGEPTSTTAEGSCDTSSAAEHSALKDSAARRSQDSEEKKDDSINAMESSDDMARSSGPRFSEVGMRLLTFFMLFCDKKNPSDNYASLVEGTLDEVSRVTVEQVVSLPVPAYAAQYLDEDFRTNGLTLRDVASPKCRALIHKLFYFLGRFDFRSETGGILLNRSLDSAAVQVRSSEWTFSTEEYNEAPEVLPGEAEAQVWETGIIPQEEVGYMGTTFKAMRRSVCFLFTKNAQAYHNEVNCRADLGVAVKGGTFSDSHIVPLIAHFDATGLDRKEDRVYKNDTNNESFITLDIFGKSGESVCLADYPYALVFPYSNYGDLFDYFFRHGVEGIDETREICCQIGKSLSSMHEKGIIHGNVAMRNIVLFPPMEDTEVEEGRKHWALTNLSGACRLQDRNSYMGKVCPQGLATFYSASLPPEMFVKLDQEELRQYKNYWDAVEKEYGASIDRSVVEPVVDFHTGASYVMRCHFVPSEDQTQGAAGPELPPLPYKLLPARESADIWAFGQLLFMLCSSGRPLFPTNARTGHLLNYKEIRDWDMQTAEAMIYEYVENPLAQDILIRLLSPYEKRASLTMEAVLSHPFFNDIDGSSPVAKSMVDKRIAASVAYRRWLDNNVSEKSEEGWLKERTISVACWDFDFQTRIHLTPTALIPSFLSRSAEHLGMPCSFITLPYKLVRNKKGVLTPPSKRDVERAERLGLRMLALSKACHFANVLKKVVESAEHTQKWSSTSLLESMALSTEDFSDLQSRMTLLASQHVEEFRSDPLSVGLKLIHEHITNFLACYDDASKVLLYLVDEYQGVPVVNPASAPFPCSIQSSARAETAIRGLPFMYMCARYARAIGGVPGFVKLIFEAASPHVPPSWQPVCKGLDNSLNRESISDDMTILCDALSSYSNFSLDDSFEFMQNYISEVDPRRIYANLQRVSSGEASVWTGSEGVREIQEAARGFGFREAIDTKMKTDQKLMNQQSRIEELEAEIEKLRFRKDLALEVPEVDMSQDSISTPVSSASRVASQVASALYEKGMKCMEANVEMISSSAEIALAERPLIKEEEDFQDAVESEVPIETGVAPEGAAVSEVAVEENIDAEVAVEEKADVGDEMEDESGATPEALKTSPAPLAATEVAQEDTASAPVGANDQQGSVETSTSVGAAEDIVVQIDSMEDEIVEASLSMTESQELDNLAMTLSPEPTRATQTKNEQDKDEKGSFNVAEHAQSLLDSMFAEADLVFSEGAGQERTRKAADDAPRASGKSENTSPAATRETREEDTNDQSTISSDPAHSSTSSAIQVTKNDVLALKEKVKAGRAVTAAQEESRGETLSELFQKEMNNFQSVTSGQSKDTPKSPSSIGIVDRTKNIFSSPKVSDSREPSEVSSAGNISIQSGSVKRLTNMFLSNANKSSENQHPTIQVSHNSPDRQKVAQRKATEAESPGL